MNDSRLTARAVQDAGDGLARVDVLPEDHFARAHLPGALNLPVYGVDFLDKATEAIPDKARPVVVYGWSEAYKAAPLAQERLLAAGWTNVARLEGGLQGWMKAGLPVEGEGLQETPWPAGTFHAKEDSVVHWEGRNLLNRHYGTLPVHASIETKEGKLLGGEATFDLTRIRCEDIADKKLNEVLIAHLRHDDFFATDRFPEARLVLENAVPIEGAVPSEPNVRLRGALTLRGVTHPLDFEALFGRNADGTLGLQALLEIDRTKWGVNYGSAKVFEALSMHLVSDRLILRFQLAFPLA